VAFQSAAMFAQLSVIDKTKSYKNKKTYSFEI
jgi:hypothetical protein